MFDWVKPEYKIVHTEKQLDHLCGLIKTAIGNNTPIAIDVETHGSTKSSGLNPYQGWLLGFSVAFDIHEGYYLPITHTKKGVVRKEQLPLQMIVNKLEPLVSKGGLYLNQNIKFDYKFLWNSGIHLYPVVWDTMIAAQMIHGDSRRSNRLKDLIPQYVNIPPDVIMTFKEAAQGEAAEVDPVEFCVYAINDVIFDHYLYKTFKPIIDADYSKLFYEAEMPVLPLLAQMELKGIRIDADYYKKIGKPIIKCLKKIKDKFQEVHNVKISSPAQVGKLLESFKVQLQRNKKTGNVITDVEALQVLKRNNDKGTPIHQISKHILEYRGLSKALDTYIKKYPNVAFEHYDKNGDVLRILHTNFKQLVNSGRQSSSPNVQNIPRDGELYSVRKGFVAREGYKIVEADWASAEYRLIAVASQDARMLKAYKDDPLGADFHRLSAQGLFNKENVTSAQRHKGKTFNFSTLYLGTAYTVSKTLDCSKDQAQGFIDNFFARFEGYAKWTEDVRQLVTVQKYTETFFGRKRYAPSNVSPDMYEWWLFESAVRALLNHIIQGTCADLLKFAMVGVAKEFARRSLDAYLLTTTHDSIVVETTEVDEVSAIMKDTMETTIGGIFMPVDIMVKNDFSKVAA